MNFEKHFSEEWKRNKFHVRHLMLCEFRKHDNATNATNAINAVYSGALDTKTCQRWFKKFKNDDFNLFDGTKSGRLVCVFTSKSPSFCKN